MTAAHSQTTITDSSGQGPATVEDYLHILSPTLKKDYTAVINNGTSPSVQADKRGVNTSTVSTNVERATTKLVEAWRQDQATPESTAKSGGYDVELVPVGGSSSGGEGTAIGKYTFQTDLVRDRVCAHLNGRTLNACAGKTILPHDSEVHRNDISTERPAIDTHYDVTVISEKFSHRSFQTAIFDPPFDSTQADKHYEGWHVSEICAAREELAKLIEPGGVLIELGWSSHSVSSWEGWEPGTLYLFQRGPTVPDTFMTVDRKVQYQLA